ncbi:Histidine kinase CKI1-like protein, partial [Drosera capensis]
MGIRSRPSSIEAIGYWMMIQDCAFSFGWDAIGQNPRGRNSPFSPSTGAEIAPPLFEALSTIPLLTQVSCISLDGLFFSYYKDGAHTFAVYSNTTFVSNSSIQNPNYTWYTQLVHSEDGALYGDVGTSRPINVANSSWFLKSLNRSDGCTSLGGRWDSM